MHRRNNECFLCHPDSDLVYLRNGQFYAMLGIGAILEGYSVLSINSHIRSFFDIPLDQVEQFQDFRYQVRRLLSELYGPVIITEHGRVPASDFYQANHSLHCYHAHQLVFPIDIDLVPDLKESYGDKVMAYSDFIEARKLCDSIGEYLCYEKVDGACYVAHDVKYKRQFFRFLVAEKMGFPNRADWRKWQGWDLINSAKDKLRRKTFSDVS